MNADNSHQMASAGNMAKELWMESFQASKVKNSMDAESDDYYILYLLEGIIKTLFW